jgi:hypothetical protein
MNELRKNYIKEAEGDIIISNKPSTSDLGASEMTYVFNIAIYKTVLKLKSGLKIIPEDGGRSPNDFAIGIGKKIFLIIEHENYYKRITYNFNKLLKKRNSQHYVLIAYIKKNQDPQKIFNDLKKLKKNSRRKILVNLIHEEINTKFISKSI